MGKSNFNGFAILCKKFSSIGQAKLQEGIFVGSQIREVFKDPQFKKFCQSWNFVLDRHSSGCVLTF